VRLVHLADLHLGYRQYHRLTPGGLNQREADVAGTLERALDQVIARSPDVVVIAGDVFHTVRPMNPAIVNAFVQFRRLRKALPGAELVMIAGNHDVPRSSETGCILELFSAAGFDVVHDGPRALRYPDRDLTIFAVPDTGASLPRLVPPEGSGRRVLLLHGEVEGMLPVQAAGSERAAVTIPRAALHLDLWDYAALGHYHVHREVAHNACYSGSLDYTSTNIWGELDHEQSLGLSGKGFVEVDLDSGTRRFHHVPSSRRLMDLPPVRAAGLSVAEVNAAIRGAVESVEGGIDDCLVRLIVTDAPRHLIRDLDHRQIREFKRRALYFHFDARAPERKRARSSIGGAPGKRPTLPERVRSYLAARPLDRSIDRESLTELGLHYLAEADAAEERAPVQGP
jgi:DNA repair exonuclease SbcCD nuclease subunit